MGSDNLPPDGPGKVLTGEILPAGHMSDEEYRKRRRGGNWRTHALDEDDIAEIVRLRVARVPLRVIADRYGISHETVRKWTKAHVGRMRQEGADIAQKRAEQAAQLMTARDRAWQMYHGSTHPAVRRDALAQVNQLTRSIIELLGLRVPVVTKTEVTVTEITQEDLKLQEMIREAQAKAANARATVEREFKAGA